ncbi:MAG: ABC transporter permease, partial [Thermoanaerobaculia bacterium]
MTAEPLAPVAPSRVFFAILRRDLTVARRELPYFLVRTALQPILFVIVFGYILPKMGMIGHGYSTTMLPG